jgi:hypothetical protein
MLERGDSGPMREFVHFIEEVGRSPPGPQRLTKAEALEAANVLESGATELKEKARLIHMHVGPGLG